MLFKNAMNAATKLGEKWLRDTYDGLTSSNPKATLSYRHELHRSKPETSMSIISVDGVDKLKFCIIVNREEKTIETRESLVYPDFDENLANKFFPSFTKKK